MIDVTKGMLGVSTNYSSHEKENGVTIRISSIGTTTGMIMVCSKWEDD